MSFWKPNENKKQRRLKHLNWRKDGLTNHQRVVMQRKRRLAKPQADGGGK